MGNESETFRDIIVDAINSVLIMLIANPFSYWEIVEFIVTTLLDARIMSGTALSRFVRRLKRNRRFCIISWIVVVCQKDIHFTINWWSLSVLTMLIQCQRCSKMLMFSFRTTRECERCQTIEWSRCPQWKIAIRYIPLFRMFHCQTIFEVIIKRRHCAKRFVITYGLRWSFSLLLFHRLSLLSTPIC